MILVTGAAGFIGSHVCRALLARGSRVIGIDSLNDYYDVQIKRDRLAALPGMPFVHGDICENDLLAALPKDIDRVVHLAAYAGVRHGITHPHDFASNMVGHLNMLEFCRQRGIGNFVYASSSSVYGHSRQLPLRIDQSVDEPISLYAATKRSNELLSASYAHLYDMKQTGLRFFTVYGEWGRPDMAVWKFTDAILRGEPIEVYGYGDQRRDFTYIDDVVDAVLAALDRPRWNAVYNVGAEASVELMDLVTTIERATGKKAECLMRPQQDGDVQDTFADIWETRRDLGFEPKTKISEGIPKFVDWFTKYRLQRV